MEIDPLGRHPRELLVDGLFANRALVLYGAIATIAALAIILLLQPSSDSLTAERSHLHIALMLIIGLDTLLLIRPFGQRTYFAIVGAVGLTGGVFLLLLWDSYFGSTQAQLHRGAIPLELLMLPHLILFCFAYALPSTARALTSAFVLASLGLGLAYLWQHRDLAPAQLAAGIWTLTCTTVIAAHAGLMSWLHLLHRDDIVSELRQHRELVQNRVERLRHRLEWDEDSRCLTRAGVLRRLGQDLSQPADWVLLSLQYRHHPAPQQDIHYPPDWKAEQKRAVERLKSEITDPQLNIGWLRPTVLMLWLRDADESELVQQIEGLQLDNGVGFIATGRRVYSGLDTVLPAAVDLAQDLVVDLFLRAYNQPS